MAGMQSRGSANGRVRVVLADNQPLYREGARRALCASGQVEVVGEASDGRAALRQIRERRPDVAVVDQTMPDIDGVAVTGAVVRDGLATRVIVISGETDGEAVYRALQTGAAGYLPREVCGEGIVEAVVACARGEAVLAPEAATELVSSIRLRSGDDGPGLSEREREILQLVADGRSLAEIARELHLALTTVKTHTRHAYEKLGVSDKAAAVAEALRAGLID